MMKEYYSTRYSYCAGRIKVWRAVSEYLQRYIRADRDCVVDLGAGYCDFINTINARKKIAIDIYPEGARYCGPGVEFIRSSVVDLSQLQDNSTDVIFASNILEHFSDEELDGILKAIYRILKEGGRLIIIQPNFRYCAREYFDDYTHKKAFTHHSLSDMLEARGFSPLVVCPRFLPFSFKSRVPKSYWLTRIYLRLPFRPMARQMLLVFAKRGGTCGKTSA